MKRHKRILNILIALFIIAATLLSAVGCAKEYEAPNFTVLDSELRDVELYDYIGKPIVLNFWATWCYYCKVEMPDFNEAAEKYKDVAFMMVNYTDGNRETVKSASDFIRDEGYTFPVFYDTMLRAADAYGIEAFPTTYFIDARGRIVFSREGMMDGAALEYYIEKIR